MHRGMNRAIASKLTTLIEKLSGEESDNWESALEALLDQEDPWKAYIQLQRSLEFGTPKTVTIGGCSHEYYLEAIKKANRSIEPNFALPMIHNVPLKVEVEQMTVVRCEGSMLHRWPNYQNVVRRMSLYGLTYCHPEVALALASDRKLCGGASVITEGVMSEGRNIGYFKLAKVDGERWLESAPIDKDHEMAYANSAFYLCHVK